MLVCVQDVIHFNATQATLMGHQYWEAYQRAMGVETPVASAKTATCPKAAVAEKQVATVCTK